MTNLDGLCQGGPEGEKYPKTTWTGKATKKTNKKEVWKSLVRASSLAQPTEEKKEEEEEEKAMKCDCVTDVKMCLKFCTTTGMKIM